MSALVNERTDALIQARRRHPAWQLLASHRAPLLLSCLEQLFDVTARAVQFEDALQALATLLQQHKSNCEFEIAGEDPLAQARRELRTWIRRALIVERDGYLYATDALEAALRFVESLEERILTSTGPRLSLVQRGIESLEQKLNPDLNVRADHERRRIEALQQQLQEIELGHIPVLSDTETIEGIRDIYRLATELKADFRRVEDSWHANGMRLRQSVVDAGNHRGAVIDNLLNSDAALLDTPEGRAFDGFHQQLAHRVELAHMHERLRTILAHAVAPRALTVRQREELKWLVPQLIRESHAVLQARTRIERDVRGYLRTDLALEHHRVGALLSEFFAAALDIDWDRDIRRAEGPWPPIGLPLSSIPLAERLLFKSPFDDDLADLDLTRQAADLRQASTDFWEALNALDRATLLRHTRAVLQRAAAPMSIAQLASAIAPTHDIENVALWLSLALRVQAPVLNQTESFEVRANDARMRVVVPKVELLGSQLEHFEEDL